MWSSLQMVNENPLNFEMERVLYSSHVSISFVLTQVLEHIFHCIYLEFKHSYLYGKHVKLYQI
jgi:hypothetical protein